MPVTSPSSRRQQHWRHNKRLTLALLLLWALVTFGAPFYAHRLSFSVLGWPFGFWAAAQGALLVDVGLKLAGQPITLDGTSTNTWISRALCDTLQAWAALPGIELALVLRGTTHAVIFDHAQGGFAAQPIWRLADGEITPELFYRPTFRFLKV